MAWPSHNPSDHWNDVPFNNMAGHSTTPEPRSSIPQLIDSTSSSTFFPGEPFPHNLLVQPSYNPLESISFVDRHAYHDPIERNEHHQATMRDGLSLNDSMPTRSTLPCSSCSVSRQSWPTGPPSSLPNTHSQREKIECFICKWENCRKPFKSKGTLMRHIGTQHIAPRSFKCTDHTCDKFFSRKDNMEEHVRRVHWARV